MKAKRGILRRAALVVSLAGFLGAAPAHARAQRYIRVEEGTLPVAIRTIAAETGAEIVSLEPGFALQRVKSAIVGPDPVRALRQVLKHTPFKAVSVGKNSFRIVRRTVQDRPPVTGRSARGPDAQQPPDTIVVEGKFPTQLGSYPGSVSRVNLDSNTSGLRVQDFADLVKGSPALASTAFGDGREKVFIRGVADSSFNGAAQPTTSIYFGNALIGFGSPNPNLRLYDVSAVEVLEGPQGTLYGSGSVGGVIRIVPKETELDRFSGSVTAAADLTAGGEPGRYNVAILNAPIKQGHVGLRLVAYDESAGGYIDDQQLGKNLNQVSVSGARATVAGEFAGSLSIEGSAVFQQTSARDSQYADSTGPLSRSTTIAEPYRSDLMLGVLSLKKRWSNGVEFNSVGSLGKRSALDRFDASAGRIKGRALEIERSSVMVSSENRLSGITDFGLNWVAGIALDYVKDAQARAYGLVEATSPLDEVTNLTKSASVFSQGRINVWPQVEATAGLRFSLSRTDSRPARNGEVSYIDGHLEKRLDPTLALLWHARPGLSVYARFQTGYRNGGVTVARGIGKVATFEPDSIVLGELGARYFPLPRLSFTGALSLAHWSNVLGDLVTQRGTPISTNLGSARIFAIEGSASWESGTGWSLATAFVRLDSRMRGGLATQSAPQDRLLPSTPKFSATGSLRYTSPMRARTSWSAGLNIQYTGRSVLGSGPLLDMSQGQYTNLDFDVRLTHGRSVLSLQVDNVLNTQASRFALGNPLTLYRRDGRVPVRPRTASLAATINW